MAVLLVDYENVGNNNGLKGVDFLNETDLLCIFFSNCCGKIRAEYMQAIEQSGCEFKTYKLLKSGKNALDFYIASECGAICQSGQTQIAIISRDKGFSAVTDFIRMKHGEDGVRVVVEPDVEKGLMSLNASEDSERRKALKEKTLLLDIEIEQARMEERKIMRQKLLKALEGTGYEDVSTKIVKYVERNRGNSLKALYTGALHNFGRHDGVAIYQILKNVV